MNYLELVNKDNLIKDSYFNDLKLVDTIDIYNCPIKVEEETYKAYLKLKEYIESINIYIGIESAYRTIEEQQKIIDEFKEKYGEEYVLKYVAPIKTSEHHTGLAIDLNIKIDNKYSEDSNNLEVINKIKKETYEEIHKHLYKFGFILRYPKNKELITGYNYEMWHIRYVGLEPAKYIYENNLTLEEYLKGMIQEIKKGFKFILKDPIEIVKSEELKRRINDNWNEFIKGKEGYFNGDIYVICNQKETESEIIYEVGQAKYADLVYAKEHKELTIYSLFSSILLKTKDDFYTFILNSHNRVNIIGGLADIYDFTNGIFIPEKCLERELKEEINIDINDKNIISSYNQKYLSLPGKDNNIYPFGVVYTGEINYTKDELKEHLLNNKVHCDNEIKDIIFISDDAINELNKIENKEPYLIDLMINIIKNK